MITKKNSCGSKIPPPPHNFSNGPSLKTVDSKTACEAVRLLLPKQFFWDTHSKQNKLFPSLIDILGPIYVENICHPPSRANFIFVSHLKRFATFCRKCTTPLGNWSRPVTFLPSTTVLDINGPNVYCLQAICRRYRIALHRAREGRHLACLFDCHIS